MNRHEQDNSGEVGAQVEDTQIKPVAGIWLCPHCGRRIQVITSSEHRKVQAFTCVCGTSMEPGPDHAPPADSEDGQVDF